MSSIVSLPPLTTSNTISQNTKKIDKHLFALLIIASSLFYGYTIFSNLESFTLDIDLYRELGVNLRVHGVYGFGERPTAYRPPLYPILLAATSYVTGLLPDSAEVKNPSERLPNTAPAILNFLFAILTVALTYRIGRRIGFSPWIVAIVGLLVLTDQTLLFYVHLPMTETIATFLIVMVIDQFLVLEQSGHRYRPLKIFTLGLLFGISALCRPTFLVFGLLCFPFLILLEWLRNRSLRALLSGMLLLVGIACFIIPWGLRNQSHFGRFILTTTHGGVTLLMMNNDPYYNSKISTLYVDRILRRIHLSANDKETVWPHPNDINDMITRIFQRIQIPFNRIDPDQAGIWIWRKYFLFTTTPEQELILDDAYYFEAKKAITSRKIDFIKTSLERVIMFWYPQTIGRFSFNFYLYVTEFLLMLCGILFLVIKGLPALKGDLSKRTTFTAGIWLILSILSIQLPHLFYNVYCPRMRAPLQPIIVLLAVYGLCSLVRVYRERRSPTMKNQ